jgi:large subunit ribosomal protein L28
MARTCDLCGKGSKYGNHISHAHNVTRRRWNPNLRSVHALVDGTPKTINACTSCIRSGKVVKVAKQARPSASTSQ